MKSIIDSLFGDFPEREPFPWEDDKGTFDKPENPDKPPKGNTSVDNIRTVDRGGEIA